MTANLGQFPAPYLGGPLTGRTNDRNTESAERFWGQCAAYGYVPRVSPDGATVTATVTRGQGERERQVTVTGVGYMTTTNKGEAAPVFYGYAGSEWLCALTCTLCGRDVELYASHIRRGAGHEGPCKARGKAARVAAVAELHGGNAPEAPAPAEYRNGHGGTLGQTEAAPVAEESAQATETATTARTEATRDAAAGRPAPAPEARPPRARRTPQRRVSPEKRMAISAGLVPAPTDTDAPLF